MRTAFTAPKTGARRLNVERSFQEYGTVCESDAHGNGTHALSHLSREEPI